MITKLLEMSTEEVFDYLREQFPDCITDGDNYIYEPHGLEHNTLLVAHIDTVDDSVTTENSLILKDIKQDGKGVYSNSGTGVLGADDRAGVFAILKILQDRKRKNLPLPPVLFTNYEEFGGIGVSRFCASQHLDRKDIHLMVEIDREGRNQFVVYSDNDQEVLDYATSFGYTEHTGIYSDIKDLSDEFDIPSINVSAGYFNQHTGAETLNMNYLWESINKVKDMLDNPIDKCYNVRPDWGGKWLIEEYPFSYDEDVLGKFLDKHTTPVGDCLSCGDPWEDCRCGTMLGLCSMNLGLTQVKEILDNYVYQGDYLYRGILGLKEYLNDIK